MTLPAEGTPEEVSTPWRLESVSADGATLVVGFDTTKFHRSPRVVVDEGTRVVRLGVYQRRSLPRRPVVYVTLVPTTLEVELREPLGGRSLIAMPTTEDG